jgi:hypothetical protein
MSRLPFYDSIQLTPEELEEAILQGKIKKYLYEKNKHYWQEKEGLAQSKMDSPTIQTVKNVVEERSPETGYPSHTSKE